MKVTDNSTYRLMQTNLDRITNDLLDLRTQGATGLKLAKPSDDPGAIRPVLTTRTQLQQNDRYLETMGQTSDKMAASDGHLAAVENVLVRVKEIAINSINSSLSQSDLDTLADEIAQLKNELLDSANAVVDGKFIFAGYLEDTPPFTKNVNYTSVDYDRNDVRTWPYHYNGDSNPTELEITPGEVIKANLTGNELFMGITNEIAAAGYSNPYQGETINSGALSFGTPGNDITLTADTTPPTLMTVSGADLTDNPGDPDEYNYAGKVADLFNVAGDGFVFATANAASADLGPLSFTNVVVGEDSYDLDITTGGLPPVSVSLDGTTYPFSLGGMASALAASGATNTTATSGTLANGVSYDISSGSLVLTGPADGSEIELAAILTDGPTAPAISGGITGGNNQTIYGTFSLTTNSAANVSLSGTGLASVGLGTDTLNGARGIDLFTVLTQTEEAIRAGNVNNTAGPGGSIQSQLANLETAANQNRSLRSNLGARAKRVDTAIAHQEDAKIDLKQILSRYEDADVLQVFNDIMQKETAFKAALNVTGRVSQISILDYL